MPLELSSTGTKWAEALLSFFYPEVCQRCEKEPALPREGYIGTECRKQIRFTKSPYCERCGQPFEGEIATIFECSNCRSAKVHFSYARSVAAARDVVNDLVFEVIRRYKYRRALWFEPFLAELLVTAAVPQLQQEKWDIVVPVPLHPRRRRQREFNQSENLAGYLAKALDLPLKAGVVRRIKDTESQTHLSREERAANVHGAFEVQDSKPLQKARVILIDDVLTTGATTNACAGVIRKAGAAEVCVWTVTRGILK